MENFMTLIALIRGIDVSDVELGKRRARGIFVTLIKSVVHLIKAPLTPKYFFP